MKKTIALFLLLTILFQSCNTYKTVATEQLVPSKYYKIKLYKETVLHAQFKENNHDTLTVVFNNKITRIAIRDIAEIKREKVSTLKTIGGGILVVSGILLLTDIRPKNNL